MKKLTYVLFALLAVPLVAQAATTDAEELGRCIYNNTSSVDKRYACAIYVRIAKLDECCTEDTDNSSSEDQPSQC
mgnify:CR=1 FL=1